MILLALILAAAPARVVLVDDLVRVPPSQWRAIHVLLKQRGAVVECRYSVEHGGSGVRVALMSREEAERFHAGRSHRPLISMPFRSSGTFRHPVTAPGEYQLVIDNRMEGRGPALVHVRLTAVFNDPILQIRELSAERRTTVVSISLGLFALIGVWAGWRFWRASSATDAQHD